MKGPINEPRRYPAALEVYHLLSLGLGVLEAYRRNQPPGQQDVARGPPVALPNYKRDGNPKDPHGPTLKNRRSGESPLR